MGSTSPPDQPPQSSTSDSNSLWEHVFTNLFKLPDTVEEGINLWSSVQFHQLTTLKELFMWEASDFQYGIITCQLPSPHDSSLLIALKPNTIKHLLMLWKYLQHLYLDLQISIMSDNANDVLDFTYFQHVTFQWFMSWRLNEATTSSSSPPSSVVHPSPTQATMTSPSISTHLLNFKRCI